MVVIPQVGTVLSHGYLVCGFLRVVFPALAYILLGTEVEVPADIHVETLADSLCSTEASVIKNALMSTGTFCDVHRSSLFYADTVVARVLQHLKTCIINY